MPMNVMAGHQPRMIPPCPGQSPADDGDSDITGTVLIRARLAHDGLYDHCGQKRR